jgi:hypothetical protein
MDAIQTLQSDINSYLSGNSTHSNYKDYWQYLFESYIGGEEYRNAGHLVKYQNESAREYRARLESTPMQNHCQSVISVYNSFLFRQPPVREFGSIEGTPALNNFLKDADMDGRNFNTFMKDVSTISSIFGAAWVIVSKPNVGATTLGAEIEQGVRPYVNVLSPLVVLDWSYQRLANGKYVLDKIKYIEDANGEIITVKEWNTETITTTVVDKGNDRMIERFVEDNGLGMIPVVIVYNKRSIIRGIGISDIGDIADAQKFIYNAMSEIDQSIRLDSHPSLVKTESTNAGVGAGAIIHMDESLDPGLKPYILDHSGASVDKILATIDQTVGSIDKMANTGAVRATSATSMSGVAMETEFQLLNARLSEKGDNLELAEEYIWQLFALYQGTSWDGLIEYPNSFNLRDAANDLELYLKASTTSAGKNFRKQLHKQIARTVIEDELALDGIIQEIDTDEYDPHVMQDPDSGETRIVVTEAEHLALAAQGWIHP